MLTRTDDLPMFICDCPSCGRRELRSARWLRPLGRSWVAPCRTCGAAVYVVDRREPAETAPSPAPQAA
jgi:hypothetical protein